MKCVSTLEVIEKTYVPLMDNIVFDIINYPISSSYIVFFPRLFNLSYGDFLRMVRDKYNATLKGKTSYMVFYFKNKKDCDLFVIDCNKRFDEWRSLRNG